MSVEYTVSVTHKGQVYKKRAEYNTPLYAVLYQNDFINHTPSTCNGKGICGKCLIKASGRLNPLSPEELSLIGDQLADNGYRLACFCYIKGDCTVTIPEPDQSSAVFVSNVEYGFTMDVGTDLISVSLQNTTNEAELCSIEQPNCQLAISPDIQDRIDICNKSPKQSKQLRNMLLSQINLMMTSLSESAGVDQEDVTQIYAVGNTCMLHMLAGLDISSLSEGAPITRDNLSLRASDVGFSAFKNACLNISGVISGNIGSDAVAAALVTGIYKSQLPVIIINFGTANGTEILMGNRNILLVSSCDHGVSSKYLSCGSLAGPGVIHQLHKEKYKICYSTIGNLPPVGISISAAFQALEIMLDVGLIDQNGVMLPHDQLKPSKLRMLGQINGEHVFFIDRKNKIYINQQDIYLLQKIKASVSYTLKRLMDEFDITHADELSAVYLCGQFGGMLNVSTAINIGMLPSIVENICFGIGNASSQGASMLLHSPRARATAEHIRTYARILPPDHNEKEKLAQATLFGKI